MNKCDICRERPAEVKVGQMNKDGKLTELSLCRECARRRGLDEVQPAKSAPVQAMVELKAKVDDQDARLVCTSCGLTYADFKRQGRLGCEHCYVSFQEQLRPLVQRIHGVTQHVGRTTKSGRKSGHVRMTTDRIREALATAIKNEDYEKAAALRDDLKKAEGGT